MEKPNMSNKYNIEYSIKSTSMVDDFHNWETTMDLKARVSYYGLHFNLRCSKKTSSIAKVSIVLGIAN